MTMNRRFEAVAAVVNGLIVLLLPLLFVLAARVSIPIIP
jgi:hypothetical protein